MSASAVVREAPLRSPLCLPNGRRARGASGEVAVPETG
jgi:hypothetical protein